ncbi:bifunctional metallophosphatase/5'-nucleotidase [Dysosmobacter sp.]|uniref:bifunctional metallophosphatase/5'-nucleotidase n=1 Tax=Dysosmobacter sp. TaxID=2591382 RepID=UPI002A9C16C5|nr:bifunctional UDP-sugar hydrolase/5'-nucleotidase [Dysosmobacter sp.]MDY5612469.1 bifunctional UDP-sugar hydrolase/5'-nucleotidase [Dysosmobacter sp.]
MKRRFSALLLALVLICSLCGVPADAAPPANTATILFTHDLHSHFLPQPAENGGESGGYARLKTAIDAEKEKYPDALLLDGGDFSIGSLIQTLYTTQAAELRTMGALGYDATTIGNHEFDHTGTGFAEMLNAAKEAQAASINVLASSQYPPPMEDYREQYGPLTVALPALLEANYRPADSNPDKDMIQKAMDHYGVQETMLLERGGVTYGIFGLMGVDADECAPTSGFAREDAVQAAKRCVASLKEQGAQFIICLSHSGTGDSLETSEDEDLAKAVDGIDVILSGHTHSTLTEPIVVNGTYIVSAGPYCRNLGVLTVEWKTSGERTVTDYRLVPIDETLAEDPDTAAMVETWKTKVGETYLSRYDLTYDQVLTATDFDLNTPVSGIQQGNNLGELVADAFLWVTENLEVNAPDVNTVSVTADGVLRAPLRTGDLTATQAFDVLSMGVGADGTSGFPLVAVYLSGKELKAAAEVDASVTPIMPAAQLYMGGMEYAFNTHRMFFNRVTDAQLYPTSFSDGSRSGAAAEIEDDQLYRVVTGMYSAQMLGTVKSKSMGLLSLEPKMADGSPVMDFNDCILYDKDGNEIKEWYALAAYLESFGKDGVPERYASEKGDGRKTVSRSWSPAGLLKSWNWITWTVVLVVLALILLVILLIRLAIRRVRRRKSRKHQ